MFVLRADYEDMKQFSDTMICLSGITLRLFEDDFRDLYMEPWLLWQTLFVDLAFENNHVLTTCFAAQQSIIRILCF